MDKAKNLYQNKKVLILGLGINQGGLGATKFFAQAGAQVRVTDLKDKEFLKPSLEALKEFPEIEYILGEHRYEDLDWADLIIKNPALKPDNPYIKYAKEKGKKVEMDLGIFLEFVSPKQIIGVTGTKGKSTTASLIYEALSSHPRCGVILAGNIGKSVLETIPFVKEDTLVILELSSAQLEAFGQHQTSPKWAIITNIYPDHINYHGSMEKYVEAKRFIAQYQTPEDFLFIKKGDEITNNLLFLEDLKGQINYFKAEDLPQNFSPKLQGEHNLENIAAALQVSSTIPNLTSKEQVLHTLENFSGVEFRLQLIYDKNGIKIYNDTAATNPSATIQALQSIPNSILIAGGVNKDLPYEELAKAIEKYTKEVYFLEGTATDAILSKAKESHQKIQTYNNLEKLLEDIKKVAKEGDVILFSPGAASFNLFQNEFDRGRKFNAAVVKIFGN